MEARPECTALSSLSCAVSLTLNDRACLVIIFWVFFSAVSSNDLMVYPSYRVGGLDAKAEKLSAMNFAFPVSWLHKTTSGSPCDPMDS